MFFAHFYYHPELKTQCLPVTKRLTILNREITAVDLNIINELSNSFLTFSLKYVYASPFIVFLPDIRKGFSQIRYMNAIKSILVHRLTCASPAGSLAEKPDLLQIKCLFVTVAPTVLLLIK